LGALGPCVIEFLRRQPFQDGGLCLFINRGVSRLKVGAGKIMNGFRRADEAGRPPRAVAGGKQSNAGGEGRYSLFKAIIKAVRKYLIKKPRSAIPIAFVRSHAPEVTASECRKRGIPIDAGRDGALVILPGSLVEPVRPFEFAHIVEQRGESVF